jgi:hypothetical protein
MPAAIPEIVARRSSLTTAISSSLHDVPNPTSAFSFSRSNSSNNTIAGYYGDTTEPLRPTTRTLQRHMMERTISEILFDLEYAIHRKEEYRDKCKNLYSRISKLEDEMEELQAYNLKIRLDKTDSEEKYKNLKIDYTDLHHRYQRLYAKHVLVNDEVTIKDLA